MTQLRILPVRRGDACLLHSRRGSYLIDGGGGENNLPEMLSDRKIKSLRAAICTSSNEERIGGILELMASEKTVSEYWLPADLERLIQSAIRLEDKSFEAPPHFTNTKNTRPGYKSGPTSTPTQNNRLHGAAQLARLALGMLMGRGNVAPGTEAPHARNQIFFVSCFSYVAETAEPTAQPVGWDGISFAHANLLSWLYCVGKHS